MFVTGDLCPLLHFQYNTDRIAVFVSQVPLSLSFTLYLFYLPFKYKKNSKNYFITLFVCMGLTLLLYLSLSVSPCISVCLCMFIVVSLCISVLLVVSLRLPVFLVVSLCLLCSVFFFTCDTRCLSMFVCVLVVSLCLLCSVFFYL